MLWMTNKILVIEDDTAISELICMNLDTIGYQYDCAYDNKCVLTLVEKVKQFKIFNKTCKSILMIKIKRGNYQWN